MAISYIKHLLFTKRIMLGYPMCNTKNMQELLTAIVLWYLLIYLLRCNIIH